MKVNKKGQSTLEYVLVLAAIVAVLIWAAQGPITAAINNMWGNAESALNTAASHVDD